MSRKYWVLLAVAAVGVALDQVTKTWALALKFAEPATVIPGLFNLRYAENRGSAFSLFANLPDPWRGLFFLGVSVLALAFILYFYRRLRDDQWWLILAFSQVMSGALGNAVDRVRFGYVVDFLDVHVGPHHWPTFNVADIFITAGIIMLGLEMLFGRSEFSLRYKSEAADKSKT